MVGSVFEKFLLLTCIVAVVVLDYGLWSVGVAYIVAGLGRLAFIANLLVNRTGLRFPLPTMSDIGRVAEAGLPFTVGTVALNLIPRLDTFLVAVFDDGRGIFCAW